MHTLAFPYSYSQLLGTVWALRAGKPYEVAWLPSIMQTVDGRHHICRLTDLGSLYRSWNTFNTSINWNTLQRPGSTRMSFGECMYVELHLIGCMRSWKGFFFSASRLTNRPIFCFKCLIWFKFSSHWPGVQTVFVLHVDTAYGVMLKVILIM